MPHCCVLQQKEPSLLTFKNCQFPLFHIPCTTPALPAKKADSNSYTHRFSILKAKALLKQKRITAVRRTGVQGENLMKG